MTKQYKLDTTQVNLILSAGVLLIFFGFWALSKTEQLLPLIMGGLVIAMSFIHRSRTILEIGEDYLSFSPTLFGSKNVLFKEIESITKVKNKVIVASLGKPNLMRINLKVYSADQRDEIFEQLENIEINAKLSA